MTSPTTRSSRSIARACACCQAAGFFVLGLFALGFAALTFVAEQAADHQAFLDGLIPMIGLVIGATAWTVAAILVTAGRLLSRGGPGARVALLVVETAILIVSVRFARLAWSNDVGSMLWWLNVALALGAVVGLVRSETASTPATASER